MIACSVRLALGTPPGAFEFAGAVHELKQSGPRVVVVCERVQDVRNAVAASGLSADVRRLTARPAPPPTLHSGPVTTEEAEAIARTFSRVSSFAGWLKGLGVEIRGRFTRAVLLETLCNQEDRRVRIAVRARLLGLGAG